MIFKSYFLNQDQDRLTEIERLSCFIIKNETPSDEQQLNDYKKILTNLLSCNYNWLCAEYENTGKVIAENNQAISVDTERVNDELYGKSYDLFHFDQYYLRAPETLLSIAQRYKFIFGENFVDLLDDFKVANKGILQLTKIKIN